MTDAKPSKKRASDAPQVVTANRLIDGEVVYLAEGGGWVLRIEESRIGRSEDEKAGLLREAEEDVAACQVVAPYLIDVSEEGGVIRPQRYREVIRARGPSVRPDTGKQAREEA